MRSLWLQHRSFIAKPFLCCFQDRLELFGGLFSATLTNNIGPYIGQTLSGYYNLSQCLAKCFFNALNDCHFAANIGTSCYFGTFKLWPNENPTSFATSTVYIFNGDVAFYARVKQPKIFSQSAYLLKSYFQQDSNAKWNAVINSICNSALMWLHNFLSI